MMRPAKRLSVRGGRKTQAAGHEKATVEKAGDIAKVRVAGQTPSVSSMQLIERAIVAAARARIPGLELGRDPVIFGVECACVAGDHSTLAIRCGRDARSRPWQRWYRRDPMVLAREIALAAARWRPDAIFVDVVDIGAGVVDRLRQLAVENVFEVRPDSNGVREARWLDGTPIRVADKRTEMWTNMRHWLGAGCIPDHQGLEDGLTSSEFRFDTDQAVRLEGKEFRKSRGLASPAEADALACTFAEPVLPRALPGWLNPSR